MLALVLSEVDWVWQVPAQLSVETAAGPITFYPQVHIPTAA